MERITKENVEARVENVNRRMESRGSAIRYQVQGRNGYTALDRMFAIEHPHHKTMTWATHSHVTSGTKREIADYLHAMMVALDDAATVAS